MGARRNIYILLSGMTVMVDLPDEEIIKKLDKEALQRRMTRIKNLEQLIADSWRCIFYIVSTTMVLLKKLYQS